MDINIDHNQFMEILSKRKLSVNLGQMLKNSPIDHINLVKNKQDELGKIYGRDRSCDTTK